MAPTSVYLTGRGFEDGETLTDALDSTYEALRTVASLAERLHDAHLWPEPLAAKAW